MKRQILIAGYYGFGNTGDEAILSSILDDLRKHLPDSQIYIISGSPAETETTQHVQTLLWTDIPGIANCIRESDLIILGGGGIFHDYWGVQKETVLTQNQSIGIPSFQGILILGKLFKKPIIIYSVGVGPLLTEAGKEMTRQSFELADMATVRDTESLDILKSLGLPVDQIHVTADPGFCSRRNIEEARQVLEKARIDKGRPLIGVCLRDWNIGVSPIKWQGEVARALDQFVDAHDCSPVFIPFLAPTDQNTISDENIADAVVGKMKNRGAAIILRGQYDPEVVAGLIGECDFILGMRYHSLVFAINAGIPFAALSYDPKITNLLKTLDMPTYGLEIADTGAEELEAILSRVWNNRKIIKKQLLNKATQLQKPAKKNIRYAVELLNRKQNNSFQSTSNDVINEFAIKQTLLLLAQEKSADRLSIQLHESERLLHESGHLVTALTKATQVLERHVSDLTSTTQELDKQLLSITQSKGYGFLQSIWRLRLWLAPNGSKRERILRSVIPLKRNSKKEEGGTPPEYPHEKPLKRIRQNSSGAREALRTILEKNNKDRIIVFIPTSLEWDAPLFQRPHQLAIAFARQGNLVFYCEPATTQQATGFQQVEENLFISNVPMEIFGTLEHPTVITLSYNKEYLRYFKNPAIIYDYIDELDVFPFDQEKLKLEHFELCQNAALVVATSDRLVKQVNRLNPSVILCPNGVDYEHFETARKKQLPAVNPKDLETILAIRKPIIGYYGIFAEEWIDYDLIAFCANQCPDLIFLLIGPDNDGSLRKSGVLEIQNVRWLGIRPYSELPVYLRFFNAAIIPFKLNKITHSASPLKLFEFMAGNKPVVIPALQESMRYSGSLVAANAIEFVQNIRQALSLGEDPNYIERIDRIARENTWDLRAGQIINALDEATNAIVGGQIQVPRVHVDLAPERQENPPDRIIDPETPSVKGQENTDDKTRPEFGTQPKEREQVDALQKELDAIHRSQSWRLLSKYWGFRTDVSNRYHRTRNWLRKQIPYASRRRVVAVLGKAGIRTSDAPRLGRTAPTVFSGRAERFSAPFAQPSKFDVICLPIINWEFRYQRPQQLVAQFAEGGHRCFYVRQTFHGGGDEAIVNDIKHNVFDVYLPGPADLNIYKGEISEQTLSVLFKSVYELRIRANMADAIVLVDLPFWAPLAEKLKKEFGWKIVYDCMDEHAGFTTNSQKMLVHEDELLAASDLVLAASQELFRKCSQTTSRLLYLPNAADIQHFSRPEDEDPIPHIKGPIIGYYGAISEWFDCPLIWDTASAHPEWQFVLIGDTFGAELGQLASLPNVHLLGEIPYQRLPAYLKRFDVACIPFKRIPLTEATNPVKFYEYLSAGKPIVAVDLPELKQYSSLFYPVRSSEEFEAQIKSALMERSPELVHSRLEFAKQNTWQQRYKSLKEAIGKIYGKTAVIVISYNNLDYLRTCLDSIWKKTLHPNYEVIVVDNGSKPDVIDYLTTLEKHEPRLKVVLNHENLGFAQANNIGIVAAGDCSYLVLLNNDTVVTYGWLSKLIRHFDDPQIDLVGPVTNWTANEARIDVDYVDLEGMDGFAQEYCNRHLNKSFDIPMLTMYCVVMRRALIDEIGNLDERFGIGMFEDDDFSLRVRRGGGRVICVEDVFIHHWGMVAFGSLSQPEYLRIFEENRKKFEEKWGVAWQPHQLRPETKLAPYDLPQRLSSEESESQNEVRKR